MTKYVPLFFIVFATSVAHGKVFSNSYVSFQLPANWDCKVAGTEWVCRSSNNDQARQAIIVLTAKEVGPNDNFAYYNQYLRAAKTPKHRDGTVATASKVQHLNTVQIANQPWADALHLGSLLPNFYSRYLVTIKDKIAILVTFTAKKEYYTRYSRQFFDAINSLRVTATSNKKIGNIKGSHEALGVNIDPDTMNTEGWGESAGDINVNGTGGTSKKSNLWLYGLALLMAAGGAFFLIKKKKKG
ncbi:MAG: LPXTG cell wall anchor domain-containing protein [Bdellovibrionaceae bacterium]|nr:LPXTG cell wall anchor domain-containing protein [Pseudobdellovibrionaceae bacterium]